MVEEELTPEAVAAPLTTGDVIEAYPDDTPYPNRLVLGWGAGRPVHMVVADGPDTITVVVTAYRPKPTRWDPMFRTRRPRR